MAHKQHNKTKFLNGNYPLLPILFVLCIVPLIMRIYKFSPGLSMFPWHSTDSAEIDVFLHCKAVALIISAVFMVVILVYSIYKDIKNKNSNDWFNRLKQAKWIIPLVLFGLLALISTIFSKYRSFGFSGFIDQFESIWVVLAYCIITIYTFYFTRTKEDIDTLRKALFIFLFVICAIGLTQLIGHDIWQSDFGKSIYIPFKDSALKDSVSFKFSDSNTHQVYMTLYNPNYVGVFAALVLPITIMLSVGSDCLKKKLAWAIMSAVVFLCALGSSSKAFIIALVAVAIFCIFFFIRKRPNLLPIIIVGLTLFVGITFVYMKISDVNLIQYVKNALTPTKNSYIVEDFIIDSDCVTLKYGGKQISMQTKYNNFTGYMYLNSFDENGNTITNYMAEDNLIYFEDERFKDICIRVYNDISPFPYVLEIRVDGHAYRFTYADGTYTYVNNVFKADTIVPAKSAIFTDYDKLFSGRGYIWSRSIPLLKNSLILGTGADTFGLVYPHNDYVARTNAGYQTLLTTRAHCYYLQAGIQYGIPALICYLVFVAIYILQAMKICWKSDFKDPYSCLALGILAGIIGYCIMCISNDSCVAVSPIAWTFLGIGYALNYILKKEKQTDNLS